MASTRIAIIDSGGANIASLTNALDRLDANAILTSDIHEIERASHVILPGVGAAANAMNQIQDQQLTAVIARLSQPVLGICLGMQLLVDASEEGNAQCIGVIPGIAVKLQATPGLPVPNMGWCQVRQSGNHALMSGIADMSYFYFVHSYALPVNKFTLATADHASSFSAIVAKDNFYATQFHPERSAAAGSRLLRNFLDLS